MRIKIFTEIKRYIVVSVAMIMPLFMVSCYNDTALDDSSIFSSSQCEHEFVEVGGLDATCTEEGRTPTVQCSHCGYIKEESQVIEPLGHYYVIDEAVKETCTIEGKTEGKHCSRCGKVFEEQQSIPKKAHTKGELISIPTDCVDNIENVGLFDCSICHEHFYDTIEKTDIDIPIISISGDLSNISKDNKVKIKASYFDNEQNFTLDATLKLQGASSLTFPKKNYNIQFFKDDTLAKKEKVSFIKSWGKQSKYTLKANYIDFSQARNVVSCQIYGDVVRSRNIDDEYSSLINGGAIDGYPVLMFQNGIYQGLYTLNTSKDDYIFGMSGDDSTREAFLMVNDWGNSGKLLEPIPEDFGPTWELEYASTEKNKEIGTTWVRESFNDFITFLNNNDGHDFLDGIDTYTNVPRAIDSMLYTWATRAYDNSSKNILWSTYNGVSWTPSIYDMDGTWGEVWDHIETDISPLMKYEDNLLWKRLYDNMYSNIVTRWEELRKGPLSISNIDKHFVDFYQSIPGLVFNAERIKWKEQTGKYDNHISQIINFAIDYLKELDMVFGVKIVENEGHIINVFNNDYAVIRAYLSNDLTKDPHVVGKACSRNPNTGYIDSSNGCAFYFEVEPLEGYSIEKIVVTGLYDDFISIDLTNKSNLYCVFGIKSDIGITVETSLQ